MDVHWAAIDARPHACPRLRAGRRHRVPPSDEDERVRGSTLSLPCIDWTAIEVNRARCADTPPPSWLAHGQAAYKINARPAPADRGTDGGRDRWLRGHADDSGQGHHHFASVSKESGNTPSRSAASAHHSVASSELPSRLLPLPFQVKEVKHLRIHGTEQLTPSVSRSVCLHLGWQRFWRRR